MQTGLRTTPQTKSLTVAGAAQAGAHALLLPVELRCVNHTASTNPLILNAAPYNGAMSVAQQIDEVAERVERLLLRHAELQRTNALLASQVEALVQERDSFKSRLAAARARIDALIDRIPQPDPSSPPQGTSPH